MGNVNSESLPKVPSEEDIKNIKNAISEYMSFIKYVQHKFDNAAVVSASRLIKWTLNENKKWVATRHIKEFWRK